MRGTALAAVLLCLAGCGGSAKPGPVSSTGTSSCAGTQVPGGVQVIQAGPGPLPGGGRAVVTRRPDDDAGGARAELALLGVAPGESERVVVHVGDTVTVQGHGYTVARICADGVTLQPRP